MGFRFRRSLRLAPGLRINLSKSGGSVSVGRGGTTLNFSSRGTKATVALPGSGLGYSTMLKSGPGTALPSDEGRSGGVGGFIVVVIFVLLALFAVWS